MEERVKAKLEERYREGGTNKIRRGEFLLQDLQGNRSFDLQQQPWNYVMRPGEKRYMSVIFQDYEAKGKCPHCQAVNLSKEGEVVVW